MLQATTLFVLTTDKNQFSIVKFPCEYTVHSPAAWGKPLCMVTAVIYMEQTKTGKLLVAFSFGFEQHVFTFRDKP